MNAKTVSGIKTDFHIKHIIKQYLDVNIDESNRSKSIWIKDLLLESFNIIVKDWDKTNKVWEDFKSSPTRNGG